MLIKEEIGKLRKNLTPLKSYGSRLLNELLSTINLSSTDFLSFFQSLQRNSKNKNTHHAFIRRMSLNKANVCGFRSMRSRDH
jgi:hypothetical protein